MINQTTYRHVNKPIKNIQAIVTNDGELVEDVQGIKTLIDSNKIILHTSNYHIMSDQSSNYLLDVLTSTDYIRFMKLTRNLKHDTNIVMNGNYPHNRQSLFKELALNTKQFERFVRTLVGYGIIYVEKGSSPSSGKVTFTYTVNPFIIRKRKMFDEVILSRFANLDVLNKKLDIELNKTKVINYETINSKRNETATMLEENAIDFG
jgi:hypothetical protein